MPYKRISELPDQVNVLPKNAKEIWMNVFNSQEERGLSEQRAIQSAWSAVKRSYKKDGDRWVEVSEYTKSSRLSKKKM